MTRRGFTLMELLVVVGIIALLLALLLPAVGLVREWARITETRQIIIQVLGALQNYANHLGGLPPVQTGPVGHVARISGRGETAPEPVPANVNPATQGRLLDLLRTGGGSISLTGYLSPRDAGGLIHLVDGWRNPLIYQLADPRGSGSAEQRAVATFWQDRTGSAMPSERYPVVYSTGSTGPRAESDPPGAAEGFFWGLDSSAIVTEEP